MTDELSSSTEGSVEPFDRLLASGGLELFPESVRVEVETLLASGQSLEPGARNRFVKAAQRAGRTVALRQSGALEPLLFDERRERHYSIDDLAAATNLDGETLRSIERGERRIDTASPSTIASWIVALGVDRETSWNGLRRSLGTPAGVLSYTSDRELQISEAAEEFIKQVLEQYDQQARDIDKD